MKSLPERMPRTLSHAASTWTEPSSSQIMVTWAATSTGMSLEYQRESREPLRMLASDSHLVPTLERCDQLLKRLDFGVLALVNCLVVRYTSPPFKRQLHSDLPFLKSLAPTRHRQAKYPA